MKLVVSYIFRDLILLSPVYTLLICFLYFIFTKIGDIFKNRKTKIRIWIYIVMLLCLIYSLIILAIPSFMRTREQSQFGACVETLRTLQEAEASYFNDYKKYTIDELPKYVVHKKDATMDELNLRVNGFCYGDGKNKYWQAQEMISLSQNSKYYIIRAYSSNVSPSCMIIATPDNIFPQYFKDCNSFKNLGFFTLRQVAHIIEVFLITFFIMLWFIIKLLRANRGK